jgi:hypothetical protein
MVREWLGFVNSQEKLSFPKESEQIYFIDCWVSIIYYFWLISALSLVKFK